MSIIDFLNDNSKFTFSFELLPPLKGNNFSKVCEIIDNLQEFAPKYINITTHHSENIFRENSNGTLTKVNVRKRPGTVAIAAAIQNKYHITSVPHIICKGFSKEETEYTLIDLQYLGVTDLLLLRGDINKLEQDRIFSHRSHEYTVELINQVNNFNQGIDLSGNFFQKPETPFSFGVACYPEKHEEAINIESDIAFFKKKIALGAKYAVTQMFFDNQKYFEYISNCRKIGITIPIVPGIKPIVFLDQLVVLPKIFHVNFPEILKIELQKCKTDKAIQQVGIEWGIHQCKELISAGIKNLHFYTFMGTNSVRSILKEIY
ncbi:MAG: methylenetetrahydrofolate reductase [Bacteroidales bacterium OttesenSCG-928-I14]|jgi:methylenetetrahydrofolate reductase (NADPH)|nr:methylenetetrahydrofolate reductase [Bacteroidales bacterium OttesenSCG-928-I14]